ncbi:GAP1-N2 domain-containing protein [Dictyobacter arantiisoli]|uniref:GTPase-associated protein 1 N-terminal domain-containing protein n=1 Tax=Dictyobacter arantiisoli TaxID=2014874 RepID=A0A5A5T6K3_9CHLR|nr:hypothetical protein [Dictyobacter arantiisoli]GCF06806.1 hypothetical protein KDI_03700 [Dictyobacter arantiisoli]
MRTESEQLWYTWSTRGFGDAGFQIRAASPGLMEEVNSVNVHSDRIQTLLKYVTYVLPQNQKDSSELPPQQAPVSLAFRQADQERILVHKSYLPPDDESTSGSFFTHLLTDLPAISTLNTSLPFTAREAISLWGASYWKTSDQLAPEERTLPRVAFPTLQEPETVPVESERMRTGSLSRQDLNQLPREQLEFMLRAFLMRQPGQRIYIAAEPKIVAGLIWGLTHSLPRTLESMQELTFSTYERVDSARPASIYGYPGDTNILPTITGTCWLTSQTGELPAAYYQDQGVNGYALNCYNGRVTPLMPETVLARFVLFAVDCLLEENEHSYRDLTDLLKQAETEQCSDLAHFMRIYISRQDAPTQNDVQELINIVKQRLDNIVEEETPLLADLERLRRPNVQQTIVKWIARNRSWWEQTCRQDLVACFACLEKYTNYPLPSNIQLVIDTLQSAMNEIGLLVATQVNDAINANNIDSMYFWVDMLELSAPLRQFAPVWLHLVQALSAEDLARRVFQRWWQIKGENIFLTIHHTLKLQSSESLVTALTPFGKKVVDKILSALQEKDRWAIDDWHEKLSKIATPQQEPVVWIYLFQLIATQPYSELHWEWWNAYGKQRASELNQLAQHNPFIAEHLYQIGDLLVKNAVAIIQQTDSQKGLHSSADWPVWSIWNEMLSTLTALRATDIGACQIWLNLWGHLWPYIFTSTYEQWWQRQGSECSIIIRQCTEAAPDSEVAQNLEIFIFESMLPLIYSQIDRMLSQEEHAVREVSKHNLFILLRVLVHALPQHYLEAVWIDEGSGLLDYLTETLQNDKVDLIYPWEIQRGLLETWAQLETLHNHSALHPWLDVSWDTVGRLIANENLPTSWHNRAVEQVLRTPVTLEASRLTSLLTSPQGGQTFETVLQRLIINEETAPNTLHFFQHLIEIAYPNKTQMLGNLLLAAREQPALVEELLQLACLTPEETITFIENDCLALIQQDNWPEAFAPLLTHYLTTFDASHLTQESTRTFLQLLHTRSQSAALKLTPELIDYIQGWLSIGELLQQPELSKRWVRLAKPPTQPQIQKMQQLQLEARTHLAASIYPILVEHIDTEMDLTRLIDNLGPILTGQNAEVAETTISTTVLLDIAPHVNDRYQRQPEIVRLMPYLKIALEQAQELLDPYKETFLDAFCQALFADIDITVHTRITGQSALWQPALQTLWHDYLQRRHQVYADAVLQQFKYAIQNGDVEAIAQAYQNVLKEVQYPGTHVSHEERDIALLAGDVVSSYKLQDFAALQQAHQEVQQSIHRERIIYTPEIEQAITNLPEELAAQSRATRPLRKPRESRVLSKLIAQPNAEILKALEQSIQETQARTSIGTVQSKSIMLDQLNKVHTFKRLYISYRLSIIDPLIKNAPWNSKDRSYYKKEKKDLQEWQQHNEQFLRKKALEDLIDNVFINSGIESRIKQGQCGIEEFLLEQRVLDHFQAYQPDTYRVLVEDHAFTETDVKQVLRIFRRRERFAERLLKERNDLDSWLEERKKRYKDQINIDTGW